MRKKDLETLKNNVINAILENENKNLKQQLAEKDDELLQKEKKIQDLMLCEFVATTLDFNKLSADNCKLREQLANYNQDKISFCIENLEKVKEKILSYEEIYYQFLENGAKIPVFCVENFRVRQNIDNQIASLKKGVE